MPTYSYKCPSCGNAFDIVQSFTDDALTTCETCGGALRKVFSPVGVTFNGSGFYRTDSRGSASKPTSSDSSGGSSTSTSTASPSSTPATKPATSTTSGATS